ncbi:hypothetical protein IHN63_00955 [Deinococcus sp. 6YEL10]|uniref:hypothetical protein n=1 Tax=Deinococcus sp. 6YEL10 TaxID=2745870 RepID=UPI001E40405B|nr:hypothetical protein [Deinococcus sp. 6YEL10]MCD0159867.1 hypothetical protein [Deinococcus sp. 6YEL10]
MLAGRRLPRPQPSPPPRPLRRRLATPTPERRPPLAHHLGNGGTVLWSDGTLLPGVGDLTLPILSRPWLSLLSALRSPTDTAVAHRQLRSDLLHVAACSPDPSWSDSWTEHGLHVQVTTCGPWTLYRVHAGTLRQLIFPENIPTGALDEFSTRTVRLWDEKNPEQSPVILWPHARPLDDLLTALRTPPAGEREDPIRAATRVAQALGAHLALHPSSIDADDVIRL